MGTLAKDVQLLVLHTGVVAIVVAVVVVFRWDEHRLGQKVSISHEASVISCPQ